MATVLTIVLVSIVGYLAGSLNSSLLVGYVYGVDVRKHGSGNAGTTNTLRTLGKKAALLVFVGDVLKAIVACVIGALLLGEAYNIEKFGIMTGGLAAVIGHNWPVYFRFKGGKGVLTSATVIFFMDYKTALLLMGVFALVLIFTRYVSLASILASSGFPVVSALSGKDSVFIVFAFVLSMTILFRHRKNLARVFKGTENKIGQRQSY